MALTDLIHSAAGRGLFAQHMRKPACQPALPVVVRPGRDAGVMGTALDYAMRAGFAARWPELCETSGKEAAEWAAQALERVDAQVAERCRAQVTADLALLAELPPEGLPDDQAQACMRLSYLEVIARQPKFAARYADQVGRQAEAESVVELQALFELITWDAFAPDRYVALNPDLSAMGLPADADLVLDDLLLEIKTTKSRKLQLNHVRQLVAYAVLIRHGGWGRGPVPIERVGIYYARSGELLCWSLAECVDAGGEAALLDFLLEG